MIGQATLDTWHHHLSTLFPEVRPRGYLEVRGADAMDFAASVAALALLAGIAYDPRARADALALLGSNDGERLGAAGQAGLRDATIATVASQLTEIALRGCRALGNGFIDAADREAAADFFERYTRRGRSPADDTRDAAR